MARSWLLGSFALVVVLGACVDAPRSSPLNRSVGAAGDSSRLDARSHEADAGESSQVDEQAGEGGESNADDASSVGGSAGKGLITSAGSGGTGGPAPIAGSGGTLTTSAGGTTSVSVGGTSAGGSPSSGGRAGSGGTGGAPQGGSAGSGGAGGPWINSGGAGGLIYGDPEDKLAAMQIECQYSTPGKWAMGEPHFDLKEEVNYTLVIRGVKCGEQVRDLQRNIWYEVLGYEGDELLVITGFLPGRVIVKMP